MTAPNLTRLPFRLISVKIVLIYVAVAALWIAFSDLLLSLVVQDTLVITRLQTFKGWAFVGVTALILYLLVKRNVSAIQKAETALRESEEKFHMLVENTASAIFIYRDRILLVNAAMEALTGYHRADLMAMNVYDLVQPDLREEMRRHCEALLRGESLPKRCEYKIIMKGGEERWVDFTSSTIVYNGTVSGLGTAFDITEEKQAEETLQKERDKAQKYLDVVGVIVVVIDADEKLSLINKRGCQLLGYEERDIIGRNWFDTFIPENARDVVRTAFTDLIAGRAEAPEYFENPVLTKSGQERLIAWRNTLLRDEKGRIQATLSSGEDITESRLMQQELWETNQTLRSLIHASPLAVIVLDTEGIVRMWNPAAERIFGWSEEEARGKANPIVPEDKQEEFRALRGRVLRGEILSGIELVRQRKDGSLIDVSLSTAPLRNTAGAVTGSIVMVADISKRKKAERDLVSAEARFRTLVEQALAGIYIIRKGKFVYANPKFEEVFGYNQEEILSLKSVLELVAEDDRPLVAENVRKRLEGEVGSVHYTFRGKRKDGSIIDIETHGTATEFDGEQAIVGVLLDITERRKADEALRESETNLRIILNSVYDAIFIHGEDGTILDVNDKMLKMYGVSYEEAVTFSIRDDYSSSDNPLDRLPALWKDVVSGKPQFFEWKARRPNDGSLFDVEVFLCKITLKNRDVILANVRDISQRKRAEAALRESEERVRLLLESAEDIVVMQDLTGRYLYYNAAPRYGLSAEEVAGRTPYDFFDHETADRMMGQIRIVAANGQGLSDERQVDWRGQNIWFLDQVSPIKDAAGNVTGVVRISRNITERKRAQEALERSLRQNQLLLEAVGEGIYGVDRRGSLTFINPVALEMLRYEEGELTGHQIHEVIHHTRPDGTPYPYEECPTYKALMDGTIHRVTDEALWRKDGTSFPVEYVSTPIRERGEIIGSVVVFTDITERKLSEEALKESEGRYRVMAETASDAIITIDEESRVLFANSAVLKILGYRPDEIIGRQVTMLMPERLRERHLSGMQRYLRTGLRSAKWESLEFHGLRKSGHEIPIELSYGVFIKGGKHFFTGVIRDITERKLAEKEREYKDMLERFNQELQALVAERTMSLMALKLADRVRNPAAVIGWTGKRLLKEGADGRMREGIANIVSESDHLEATVSEFQALLKDKKPVFSYIDANEILREILPIIQGEAARKKIALTATLAEQPLRMNAQKDLLRMAVFNLLRNAIEATPEGGAVTTVTSGDRDNVIISVSDTGFGIPKEILDRVFDPFFSMKTPTFRIGLPLIKQIVSEHLGTIDVRSQIGRGTTFTLLFPKRWSERA